MQSFPRMPIWQLDRLKETKSKGVQCCHLSRISCFSLKKSTNLHLKLGLQASWQQVRGLLRQHINVNLTGSALVLGSHHFPYPVFFYHFFFPCVCFFPCSLFVVFAQCHSFSLCRNTVLQGQDQRSGVMWSGRLIHTEMLPKLLGSRAWRLYLFLTLPLCRALSVTHTHKQQAFIRCEPHVRISAVTSLEAFALQPTHTLY